MLNKTGFKLLQNGLQRFTSYLGRVPGLWRFGDVDVNLLVVSVKPAIMVSYSSVLGNIQNYV